jgi:membrane-bound lytic murein transglycosylase F
VALFAERQGWKIRFVVADDLEDLFATVAAGRAHLAAAGITASEERRSRLRFGPNYGQVKEWVVCRPVERLPEKLEDLVGLRVEVVAGSTHVDRLRLHKRRLPDLRWVEVKTPGSEELLERLDIGLADCTVVDSDTLDVARNFHPALRPLFVLESAQPQAWVLGRGMDLGFSRRVVAFFKDMEASGELVRLKERYFGHVTRLQEADVLGVLEKRGTLLRDLRRHFQEAQAETGLDWRLLAAIAYQESQWDAHAVSPTGVRGIMMLTEDTADHLGVKDRLDARESILGGARYVLQLKSGLPETVPEPDRTWIALAAYNIGLGHLNDARGLARKLGKDPDQWRDMKMVLPLLSRREHAGLLKYGFARGGEARAFAENVRIYYDILRKYEQPYRSLLGFN